MENKNDVKQNKIIIGLVFIIIIMAIGYIFMGKANKTEKQNNNKSSITNNGTSIDTDNNLNNGIINNGDSSSNQDMVDYINNNLVLESATVEEFDTYYDTKVWGLSNIKVKNNGDKSITRMTITVYFKDNDGNTIGENNINIGISDIYNTVSAIRPNYEWSSETDKYYQLKNLSDNINPTKNEIKITKVTFEK